MKAMAVLTQDFHPFREGDSFEIQRDSETAYLCSSGAGLFLIPKTSLVVYQVPGNIFLQCAACKTVLDIPFASDHLCHPAGWIFTSSHKKYCSSTCYENCKDSP
jgi:hypothetical protein